MDYGPPGSSVHGISQARILEWVAISFSRESFWPRDRPHVSCIGMWILCHWATREAQSILGCRFFPSFKYIMPLPSGLQNFCWKISSHRLMGGPLYAICCISLAAFNIFTLSLIFSGPFSLFSFWGPYNVNINVLHVVPEVSFCLCSIHWQSFPLFSLPAHWLILLYHLI